MNDNYFVLSDNILGLKTNTDTIKFSYGIHPPAVSQAAYEQCQVKLTLQVGAIDDSLLITGEDVDNYHHFSGRRDEDAISYYRTFLFSTELKLRATGFLSGDPTLMVNNTYFRFIPQRFMNLHSAAYMLTDMAGFFLLQAGYMPLHCSSFRKGDATVVIFAPPNTGKTLSTMIACMEHDAEYIAEDIAITDGTTVHSVPWTSTYRHYSTVDQDLPTRIQHALTKVIPIFELIPLSKQKPITTYIPEERLVSQSDITHIVVLGRGQECVSTLSAQETYQRVSNFNRYQFNYYKAPILTAYDFFNPALDQRGVLEIEDEITRQLTHQVPTRLLVQSNNVLDYATIILDAIR